MHIISIRQLERIPEASETRKAWKQLSDAISKIPQPQPQYQRRKEQQGLTQDMDEGQICHGVFRGVCGPGITNPDFEIGGSPFERRYKGKVNA